MLISLRQEHELLLRKGLANENDDLRIERMADSYCSMGVGCTSKACYAKEFGHPELCEKNPPNTWCLTTPNIDRSLE